MSRMKGNLNRVMAFFLAAVMVCSTFGATPVTAYAEGRTESVVVEEDTTVEESYEMVSEEGEEALSETVAEEESIASSEAADESGEVSETAVETVAETAVETTIVEETTDEETQTDAAEETTDKETETTVAEETTDEETETTIVEETTDGETETIVVEETTAIEEVAVEETVEVNIDAEEADNGEELPYTGDIVEEDGTGLVLEIDAWQMEENGMTVSDDTIISILEAQTEDVNVVSFNMSSVTDSISASVWSAALAVITEEADANRAIRYNQSGDTSADENWNFENPQPTENAVVIGVEWSAGAEKEGITVSFANTTFPADAWFNLCDDENKSDYKTFTSALGEGTQAKLYTTGEDAVEVDNAGAGIYKYTFEEGEDENVVTKNGINISVGDVAGLTAGTSYVVRTVGYTGSVQEWEDGTVVLEIANWDAGKENFSKSDITEILENYEKSSFNQIRVFQSFAQEVTFDGSLLNEMAAYIKEPGMYQENMLIFDYRGDDEAIAWCFINPDGKASETTNTVSTALSVSDNDIIVNRGGTLDMGGYASLNIEYLIQTGSKKGQAVCEVLGKDDSVYELSALDAKGSGIEANYRIDGEEAIVSIGDAERMVSGTDYILEKMSYRGRVDGNVLYIGSHDFDRYGETYSDEAVAEIIKSYGDTKFGRIEVSLNDSDEDPFMARISKVVFNAAMAQLDTDLEVTDGLGKGFKYIFYEADRAVVWNFVGCDSLSKDIAIGHWIGVNDEGNAQMTVSIPEVKGGIVNLELVPNPGRLTDDMIQSMGDGTDGRSWSFYPIENQQIYFNWNKYGENDDRMQIIINNINSLKNDTPYEVNVAEPANIRNEEIEGQTVTYLEFFADWVGKDTLEAGDVAKYLKAYQGQTFDSVQVEQRNVPDTVGSVNKIYKTDYNYLLTLLKADSNYRNITYVFDDSYDEEGDWHQNQMRWDFQNPTAITKDLDMSFTFSLLETAGQGIEVNMPANTWPSSGVAVEYMYDARTYNGERIQTAFGGWAEEDEEGNGYRKLIVLKDPAKLTQVSINSGYNKFISEEGKNIHTFRIEQAQKLSTAKASGKYRVVPVKYDENTYSVAQNYELKVTGTPDGTVAWKSYTPEVGTISATGELETYDEGQLFYGAAYKESDVQMAEVWSAIINREMISIKFVNASETNPIEMELPPTGENWEVRNYLDLRFYPTGTYAEASELEWFVGTVENPAMAASCVSLVTDDEGNPTGEIKAVEAGEAIVTVTYKANPDITAKAKVIVKNAVVDEIDFESIRLLGITNYDKTLADIELPEGFTWKDPKTSLSAFANSWGYDFPAVYTSPKDGRTCELRLWVQLFTFTEGYVSGWLNEESLEIDTGSLLQNQNKLYLKYNAGLENGPQNVEELNNILAETKRTDIKFQIVASSNPKNLLTESDKEFASYVFTADSSAKGKKTFTFALNVVDTATNKAKTIAKKTFAVTVLSKPTINWYDEAVVKIYRKIENSNEPIDLHKPAAVGEKGQLVIEQPKNSYIKVTAKSMDTATCKIGKTEVTYSEDKTRVYTNVGYEIKKGGRVYIQLTAADEVKSGCLVGFEAEDIMPKAESTTVTIDKTRKNVTGTVKWQLKNDTSVMAQEGITYTIKGKANSDFSLVVVGETEGKATIGVTLVNRNIKKGKYKLEVSVPVKNTSDSSIYAESFKTTITVNVISPKNEVTVKQTKKVNLFYPDYSSYNYKRNGEFYIAPKGDFTITGVELVNQSATKLCDYTLSGIGNGYYEVALKQNGNAKNTKGILRITTEELAAPIEVKVSVKTENKIPEYIFNEKSVTMYPNYSREGENTAFIYINDKKTDACPSMFTLEVKTKDGWKELEQTTESSEAKDNTCQTKNNTYNINVTDYGQVTISLTSAKKATDKLEFRIREEDWTAEKWGKLTYTIKVDTSTPKLELTNKTVTLNSHKDIYTSQAAITEFVLKGSNRYFGEQYWVSITGTDTKSIKEKNESLNVNWNGYGIEAFFNDNEIADGSYKYKVTLHTDGLPDISTNLTVKVKATDPAKCQTVKTKGSIDVLDRDGSGIVYTTKLKNVYGELQMGWDEDDYMSYLTGPDAEYFRWFVEDGQMVVKAKEGVSYNTKNTYKVTPVFVYYNRVNDSTFEIRGKEQKIKVKQGKPKVTITPVDGSDNVLYRDRSAELTLSFNALLNKTKNVKIRDVSLANYNNDLSIDYNVENQTIILRQSNINQILASGKTWNLKFNVEFEDKAGNEKVTQVTYKVVIK